MNYSFDRDEYILSEVYIMDFIAKNWVNVCLVFVGSFALVIYILQERRKRIDAACLIVLQIGEVQEKLRELSTYIVDGKLNETAFYESLPIMEENYWSKYKHYFVKKMDATSYIAYSQIWQNPSFDLNQFLNMYWQQDGRIREIINRGVLTSYIPIQIKISLEKILKEYSMLEIVGTDGYQMLKKFSKKKF